MSQIARIVILLILTGIASLGQQSYVKFEPSPGANPRWDTNLFNVLISNVTFKGNMTFVNPTVTNGPFIDDLNGQGTNLILFSSATTKTPFTIYSPMVSGSTNLIEITNSAGEKLLKVYTNGSLSIGGGTVGNSAIDAPGIDYQATWTSGGVTRTGLRVLVNVAGAPAGSYICDIGQTGNIYALRTATGGASTMTGPLTINAAGSATDPAIEFAGGIGNSGISSRSDGISMGVSGADTVRVDGYVNVGPTLLTFGSTLAAANVQATMQHSGTSNIWTKGGHIATGTISATNGFASYSSNLLASTSITVGASPFLWTNSLTKNVVVYVDGVSVTGTVGRNGSTVFGTIGQNTVILQPGEWATVTYTLGSPTATFHPF